MSCSKLSTLTLLRSAGRAHSSFTSRGVTRKSRIMFAAGRLSISAVNPSKVFGQYFLGVSFFRFLAGAVDEALPFRLTGLVWSQLTFLMCCVISPEQSPEDFCGILSWIHSAERKFSPNTFIPWKLPSSSQTSGKIRAKFCETLFDRSQSKLSRADAKCSAGGISRSIDFREWTSCAGLWLSSKDFDPSTARVKSAHACAVAKLLGWHVDIDRLLSTIDSISHLITVDGNGGWFFDLLASSGDTWICEEGFDGKREKSGVILGSFPPVVGDALKCET